MFRKMNAAIACGLCAALAACDGAPSRDLTAPEPQPASLEATALANTWATKRQLPIAHQRSVAAAFNNIIYVIGGTRADGSASNAVQAYNTATNTWSARAPLPSRRTYLHGATVINGRIYVAGGRDNAGNATNTLYVYNIATNSWVRRANLPHASACGAQGVIGDLLYVYTAGVICGGVDVEEHEFLRYNPITNTWATRAAPPTTHTWGVGRVIGGKFYLAGGRDDIEEINLRLEVYTPATNRWVTRARMPSEQLHAASGVLNGRLHVAGGGNIGTPVATLRVYNPATNTWTTRASMPTARWLTFGVNANGLLWVMGGLRENSGGITRNVEAYTP